MSESMTDKVFEVHNLPGERAVGVIYPVGYKNQCCKNKPFILYSWGPHNFNCRCECDGWCTDSCASPVEAIMQYELMCRVWPDEIDYRDPHQIRKYFKYYPDWHKRRP